MMDKHYYEIDIFDDGEWFASAEGYNPTTVIAEAGRYASQCDGVFTFKLKIDGKIITPRGEEESK